MTYTILEGKNHLSDLAKNRLSKRGMTIVKFVCGAPIYGYHVFLKVKKLSLPGTIRYFLIVHARICATFC